jgi:GR25 family glycosyltransferase involved in LPS biosynthesis
MDSTLRLNEFFDRIYCINLDSRPDRWEECLKQFESNGLAVERFIATPGDQIDFPVNVKKNEAGLILTHKKILEDAISNEYKSILILEDDVEFIENFLERFEEAQKDVPPHWDALYFGGNHFFGAPVPISDKIAIATKTVAMHCVGIKNTIYKKMLEKINYNEPIDMLYANNQSLINAFVFVPSIAWQRPSYSDLMGHFVDYGFLK